MNLEMEDCGRGVGIGMKADAFIKPELEQLSPLTSFDEKDLISDWSGFCSTLAAPFPVQESYRMGLKSSSSGSSSSITAFQDDKFSDSMEDLSEDHWPFRGPDEELGRLLEYPDSAFDGFFSFDLFPEYSHFISQDVYGIASENGCAPLPGFSVFRNSSLFDESLIPTCVRDFSENDSIGSTDINRSDERRQPMYSDEDIPSSTSFSSCESQASSSPRAVIISPSVNDDLDDKRQRRRKPGRPRKGVAKTNEDSTFHDDGSTPTHHTRKRRKQHPWKGHHLWEFIRELLENNDDPSRAGSGRGEELVRWENREKGVFLIVNSKEVAELWGKRKRNDKMTYEKLSRSLRWCRTSGFLAEVPKDRKYPKKLCFCFGHRAYDIHRTKSSAAS